MMPHLLLIVPGLRGPVTGCPVDEVKPPLMPGLTRLLRGSRPSVGAASLPDALAAAFATDTQATPEGPTARYGRRGEHGDQTVYRGAPVHLRVETDHLLLFDQGLLSLRDDESTALCECFNETYRDQGWRLEAVTSSEWYLSGSGLPAAETTPLSQVIGRNIGPFMPTGPAGGELRRLMNEIQMLFHDHPVNEHRRATDEPPANGLWLWGGGGPVGSADGILDGIWSDDPYALGLAKLAGKPSFPVPENVAAWQAQTGTGKHFLIVLPPAGAPALYGDVEQWRDALAGLERDWLAPLAKVNMRISLLPVDGTRWDSASGWLNRIFSRGTSVNAWLRRQVGA